MNNSNKLMMIIIIVLLLVLLGTIVGVAVYGYNYIKHSQTTNQTENYRPVSNIPLEDITLIELGSISGDLAVGQDNKAHTIRFTVAVGIDKTKKKDSEELIKLIEEKKIVAREIASTLARKKTYEDFKGSDEDMSVILKTEILDKLQMEFESRLIVAVYLDDFVVL